MSNYLIVDEPRPSALAHAAVQPVWPLFAMMFVGCWLAWPWHAFNGFVVGSPTRWRELLAVLVGFGGSAALVFGISMVIGLGIIPQEGLEFALISVWVWKITVSYWLYLKQGRTIELFTYLGGKLRNGMLLVIGGWLVAAKINAILLNTSVALFLVLR